MALVHHLPVAATWLPHFPQRVEDLAPGLQFNMWVKVICGSCHREVCSPRNRASLISASSVQQGSLQAPTWTLSQGQQRERAFCLRRQKSTGDNEDSVSHGKRVGGVLSPQAAIFSEEENPLVKEGVTNKMTLGALSNFTSYSVGTRTPLFLWDSFNEKTLRIVARSMSHHVGTERVENYELWQVCVPGDGRGQGVFGGIMDT